MKEKIFSFGFILLFSICSLSINAGNIIPYPLNVIEGKSSYLIDKSTKIINTNSVFEKEAELLRSVPKQREVGQNPKQKKITEIEFVLKQTLAQEAYEIELVDEKLICRASNAHGMFYAVQTIIQNLESDLWSFAKIEDVPKYEWRGLMLDDARHFFGVEVVKNLLDVLAHLKMNVFHMHLTDEDGWRIEIKKYPKLTEIGAIGNWSDREAPRKFYTQEEIKEIVAYAAERHIMVIPEIDMPGHATAISKSYPEISGGGEGRWEGFTYHPAKETTYEFIENVFDEVFELFPAPYIHIGGDEVHFGNQSWKTDPIIQQFIKDNELGDEVGLEHYFVRRVCNMINAKGRKMIGWDEILASGVTPEQAIVMWWRHDRPQELTKALERGFDVIMTPRIPCYLDFVQDDMQKIGRRWGKAYAPLEAGYKFPLGIADLIEGYEDQIKGLQANVWAERIADEKRLYYMIFPRLAGISEAGWAAEKEKDYDAFLLHLKPFLRYLDRKGINYFNPFDKESTPEPWGPTRQDVIAEG